MPLSIFATEFPVNNNVSEAMFMAEAIAWIRGIKNSFVLNDVDAKEFEEDDARIESASGEVLSFKRVNDSNLSVIGVRHELPDDQGRVWRTECVLTKESSKAYFRVRGQCVAAEPNAIVLRPRKPHLIRQAIEEEWSSKDGPFMVQATPHYLLEDEIELAGKVILGREQCMLPCVYISRNNNNTLPLDEKRLSETLSGLAHVIVEPSRSFSFSLMEMSSRKNPYGGAIGIIVSGNGEIRRFQDSASNSPIRRFVTGIEAFVVDLVSKRGAQKGWEWQALQEQQARLLRQKLVEQNSDELSEYIDQFDAELKAKDEEISNLNERLALIEAKECSSAYLSSGLLPDDFIRQLGKELFEGEFSDRLRSFLKEMYELQIDGVDTRTNELVSRILEKSEFSGNAAGLINQIKGAGRDGNQMPQQIGAILSGLGYIRSDAGKHTKYTPSTDLFGLSVQTVPKTPGDASRAGKNKASDIIKDMKLNQLK